MKFNVCNLPRCVLVLAQVTGVCLFGSDTVEGVISLTGDPGEHLERCCDPLIRVLLDSGSYQMARRLFEVWGFFLFHVTFSITIPSVNSRKLDLIWDYFVFIYILHWYRQCYMSCIHIKFQTSLQFAHLFFWRALKVFLKAGLTWLSSSTREWQRTLGTAGLGLKSKAVDLQQSQHDRSWQQMRFYCPHHTALWRMGWLCETRDSVTLTWRWCHMKSLRITKVITIHPVTDMNVFSKFIGYSFSNIKIGYIIREAQTSVQNFELYEIFLWVPKHATGA